MNHTKVIIPQLLVIAPAIAACAGQGESAQDLKLWYDKPAGQWVEALPVGNGRLGAMVLSDQPGRICFTAAMATPQKATVGTETPGTLVMSGVNSQANGIPAARVFVPAPPWTAASPLLTGAGQPCASMAKPR